MTDASDSDEICHITSFYYCMFDQSVATLYVYAVSFKIQRQSFMQGTELFERLVLKFFMIF